MASVARAVQQRMAALRGAVLDDPIWVDPENAGTHIGGRLVASLWLPFAQRRAWAYEICAEDKQFRGRPALIEAGGLRASRPPLS